MDFYLNSVDYKSTPDGNAYVRLFGRTKNNKKVCVLDYYFNYYCYILASDNEVFRGKLLKLRLSGDKKVINVVSVKKKFLGEEAAFLKVFVNNPSCVDELYEKTKVWKGFKGLWDGDVKFVQKYVVDNGLSFQCKISVMGEGIDDRGYDVDYLIRARKYSVSDEDRGVFDFAAFDIEVASKGSLDPLVNPIVMISIFFKAGRKLFTWRKCSLEGSVVCDNEHDMLEKFFEFVKKSSFSMIIGYNSDGFDFSYIRERCRINNINSSLGFDSSPLRLVKKADGFAVSIAGLQHVDMYLLIRNLLSRSLDADSLTLNDVALEVLKDGKDDFNILDIIKFWNGGVEGVNRIASYCLKDSELAFRLFDYFKEQLIELSLITGLFPFDVCRHGFSQLVESYFIKEVGKFNELVPAKPSRDLIKKRVVKTFEGGFVFQPFPGIYENVVELDFMSLYPSIIVSHNICPSTVNNHRRKGFVPVIIKDLIERRNSVKQILSKMDCNDKNFKVLKAREQCLKVLANSSFGYYGFPAARWYCFECAGEITRLGREYIKKVIDKASSFFKVIYGDTDSIFFSLGKHHKSKALEFVRKMNESLPGLMRLDFKNLYPRGIFVSKKSEMKGAKKKYAVVSDDGRIIVKGFESVRRDWSDIARELQLKVLEEILKNKSVKDAMSEIINVIKNLRNRNVALEKLVIKTQLRRNLDEYKSHGPHVKAALKARSKGFSIVRGAVIRFVVLEVKGNIGDRSEIIELVSDSDKYDIEYYINNQIIPAVGEIMGVAGVSSEELVDKAQTSLESF